MSGLHIHTRRQGFTLVELMVSVGVLAILMTMVGMIFSMATRASGQATANNEIMGGLRTLERQMARDFEGIQKDAFIGIWYQLADSGVLDASTGTNIRVRADRIVFFTAGDHRSVRQIWDPVWANSGATNNPFGPRTAGNKTSDFRVPVTSGIARVFYGHDYLSVPPQTPTPAPIPAWQNWQLARRAKLLLADPSPLNNLDNPPDYQNPTFVYAHAPTVKGLDASGDPWDASQDLYDNWEYEFRTLSDWQNYSIDRYGQPLALNQINPFATFFGPRGVMNERDAANASWMLRPYIYADPLNPANNAGLHMLMLRGCLEFKVQRWIERDPITNQPVTPRWFPEEDRDGDGKPNEDANDSDFVYPWNGPELREYFNGPNPAVYATNSFGVIVDRLSPNRWFFVGADGLPWTSYDQTDVPKAIKITLRLLDPNRRLENGQTLTMVYALH